eukprot:365067-Chlamydomonas_euryale.AAC.31
MLSLHAHCLTPPIPMLCNMRQPNQPYLGCRVVAVPGFTIAVAGTIYSARRHWLHAGAAGAIGVAVGADVSAVAVPAVAGAIFAVAAVVAGVDIANTVVYVSRRIAQLPHRLLVVVTAHERARMWQASGGRGIDGEHMAGIQHVLAGLVPHACIVRPSAQRRLLCPHAASPAIS